MRKNVHPSGAERKNDVDRNTSLPADDGGKEHHPQPKTIVRATRRYLFQVFWRTAAVAVLLIVVAVLALFAGFRRLSVREITDEIIGSLALREQMLSSLHAWAVPSLLSLLDDPVVSSAMYGSTHSVVSLAEAAQRLQHVASSNPLIHSLYVYNGKESLVVSTRSGVERERITDAALMSVIDRSQDYDSVRFIPRRMRFRAGYVPSPEADEARAERILTLVLYDRQFHAGPHEGCLVANLSEERLRHMFMEETTVVDSRFMIVNDDGVALSHFDPKAFATQVISGTALESVFTESGGAVSQTVSMDGADHLAVLVREPDSGWNLISITDSRDLTGAIASLRNVMLLVLLGVIVPAIPMSFAVAQQISQPVHRIVEQASRLVSESSGVHSPENETTSELGYLDLALRRLGSRLRELDRQVGERRQVGHQDALHHLMEGTRDPAELKSHLPEAISSASTLRVAVLRFDNYSALIEVADGTMIRSMFETITAMLPELFETPIWVVDFGRDHAAVVHPFGPAIDDDSGPAEHYRRVLHRISAALGRSITIGLSAPAGGPSEVPAAYQQALLATDYRFRYGRGHVICFEQLESEPGEYDFPHELVRHMLETLRLGKLQTARDLLEQVITEAKRASFEDYKFAVQMLVRMTRRELIDRMPANAGTDQALRKLVDRVALQDTAAELIESFADAFEMFGRRMDADRELRNQTVVDRVRVIVAEEISDPNLSVDLIAEQVGLSTNYLRDLFKTSTGTSISTLVLDKRLHMAQHQLETTADSVKQIAAQTGFQNYTYFFTAFKRSTGMTPRQYRMNAQKHRSA